jgi:hypothetical protein
VRIDVLFGAASVAPADVAGRVVAVIDVLRASTTIATALDHGARSVIPFEGPDEAVVRSKQYDRRDVLLAGERRMRPAPRLRPRQLAGRVHARGGGRAHHPVRHHQRHPRAVRHAGRP